MRNTFEVRDMRHKEKFFVDDAYLNGYAKKCGSNATLVYLCLCRHADRNQESFPSIELMSIKLGISRDSVMRGIKQLIDFNIIEKNRRRQKNAQWLNNTYFLLDKSVWVNKGISSQVAHSDMDSQVANQGVAKSQIEPSQVAHSDTKDTHNKDTHNKDTHSADESAGVIKIIDSFKEVNLTYKKWYANKTQRLAAKNLIENYTLEKVLGVIALLKKTNNMAYMPKILTPLQLEDKWASLEANLRSLKEKSEHKKSNYIL